MFKYMTFMLQIIMLVYLICLYLFNINIGYNIVQMAMVSTCLIGIIELIYKEDKE